MEMTTPTLSNTRDFLPGNVAEMLMQSNMDFGVMRPWQDKDTKRCYVTVNGSQNGKPARINKFIGNSPATLRKDEWIRMDETVERVARPMLSVWDDLVSRGLTYNVPDALGTPVLQYQTMSDFGTAQLNMDPLSRSLSDRPQYDIQGLPLPVVHADWMVSLRELAISRQRNTPLDTEGLAQNTRRCAEIIEQLTTGTLPAYSYAGYNVYGLTNYPYRITQTIKAPTSTGYTPALHVSQIQAMVQALQNIWFNGPYGLYYSRDWTQYLGAGYSQTYPGLSLRERVAKIDKITFIKKIDFLPLNTVILWQLDQSTIRGVMGMPLQVIQWETHGGTELNFKIMGIMVPQMKANYNQTTGIVHASAV